MKQIAILHHLVFVLATAGQAQERRQPLDVSLLMRGGLSLHNNLGNIHTTNHFDIPDAIYGIAGSWLVTRKLSIDVDLTINRRHYGLRETYDVRDGTLLLVQEATSEQLLRHTTSGFGFGLRYDLRGKDNYHWLSIRGLLQYNKNLGSPTQSMALVNPIAPGMVNHVLIRTKPSFASGKLEVLFPMYDDTNFFGRLMNHFAIYTEVALTPVTEGPFQFRPFEAGLGVGFNLINRNFAKQ
jgi:hypothetical protein